VLSLSCSDIMYYSQSCDLQMRHRTGTRLSYDFGLESPSPSAHTTAKMRARKDTNYVTGRPRMVPDSVAGRCSVASDASCRASVDQCGNHVTDKAYAPPYDLRPRPTILNGCLPSLSSRLYTNPTIRRPPRCKKQCRV
jgi:hypothetical protein